MSVARGHVLFHCVNFRSGLTCRDRSRHGFWPGRTIGQRVFWTDETERPAAWPDERRRGDVYVPDELLPLVPPA